MKPRASRQRESALAVKTSTKKLAVKQLAPKKAPAAVAPRATATLTPVPTIKPAVPLPRSPEQLLKQQIVETARLASALRDFGIARAKLELAAAMCRVY